MKMLVLVLKSNTRSITGTTVKQIIKTRTENNIRPLLIYGTTHMLNTAVQL